MKNLLTLFAATISKLFGGTALEVNEKNNTLVLDEAQAKSLLEAAGKVPQLESDLAAAKTARTTAENNLQTANTTIGAIATALGLKEGENAVDIINQMKTDLETFGQQPGNMGKKPGAKEKDDVETASEDQDKHLTEMDRETRRLAKEMGVQFKQN